MTATARGARQTADPAGSAPADAWAQRQLQAESMIDRVVNAAREAVARTAARAREEVEDMWAEAAQRRHDGSASG
jgi:hypothetical protein